MDDAWNLKEKRGTITTLIFRLQHPRVSLAWINEIGEIKFALLLTIALGVKSGNDHVVVDEPRAIVIVRFFSQAVQVLLCARMFVWLIRIN